MRYATFSVRHSDGWLQPLGKAFARADDITRVAVHSQRLLNDGQAIYLYELVGDVRTVRDILDETAIISSYQVVQGRESVFAYIHFEPMPTVKELLRGPKEYGLIIDGPVTIRDDGTMEITLIGEEKDIQQAFSSPPDELTVTVKRIGNYHPGTQQLFTDLSERQREVLQKAYELGYYQKPRRVTYEDIASELDCTPSNVGDMLRRIENTIINEIMTSHFGSASNSLS
ncbi:helix-turn-helix domain-containing protein [Natrinema sp. CGMCC1.2065]|uniref:helix-turn-helix domain-containing protein n=1 Tax=Natrinema sp. CGMCC1.2065 TaxID=3445767 RepID=UPI003F4A7799